MSATAIETEKPAPTEPAAETPTEWRASTWLYSTARGTLQMSPCTPHDGGILLFAKPATPTRDQRNEQTKLIASTIRELAAQDTRAASVAWATAIKSLEAFGNAPALREAILAEARARLERVHRPRFDQ